MGQLAYARYLTSPLIPDVPEDDGRILLSSLCLSPLMGSRREYRADFYDNQIRYTK